MHSVAMVLDGYVYGVLLVEDSQVKRAWLDPELQPGTLCEKMEFRHDDPEVVMDRVNLVLSIREIPEVNPKEFDFNLYSF
jgi:hypothetical protein